MTVPFSADEVFRIAEQIERDGAMFYEQGAAAIRNSPAMRGTLMDLAKWERQHEQVFAQMRAELAHADGAEGLDSARAEEFLRSMVAGRVFSAEKALTPGAAKPSVEDILRKALRLEKDSVVFYLGMSYSVAGKSSRERVESIISEEMKHIAILDRELVHAMS